MIKSRDDSKYFKKFNKNFKKSVDILHNVVYNKDKKKIKEILKMTTESKKINDIIIKDGFRLDGWKWHVLAYKCDFEIVRETEKAYLINVKPHDSSLVKKRPDGYDMWFPKSVLTLEF